MTKSFLLLLAVVAITLMNSQAFMVRPNANTLRSYSSYPFALHMSDSDEEARLRALGYTEDEIRRSRKESDREEIKVYVNEIPDVDPFTLTAIGFGLIAFNFFVLGNLGDGGIAGVIATIINSTR